ncbi:MAG: ATP-binding protein, partial [Bacillota bacterium]
MKKISLKYVISIPVILIVIILLSLSVKLWQNENRFLSKQTSFEKVNSISKSVLNHLDQFTNNPELLIQIMKSEIQERQKYFNDSKNLQSFLKRNYYLKETPEQISAIAYADKNKRFIGFRKNNKDNYSLMLQDNRTENKLNIYESDNLNSKVLASFNDFNPTNRPYFKNKKSWSDVYINVDEKKEATITRTYPIFINNKFDSILAFDIKLASLNNFLNEQINNNNQFIYILNEKNQIIAHSYKDNEVFIKKENGDFNLVKAQNTKLPLIEKSNEFLKDRNLYNKVFEYTLENKKYYITQNKWSGFDNLNWKIVIGVPESDLIGDMKQHQKKYLMNLFLISIIGLLILFYFLYKMAKIIMNLASDAKKISKGDWDILSNELSSKIYEIDSLKKALNKMICNIKKNLNMINKNKEKYKLLIDNLSNIIYTVDKNNQIVTINKSFKDNFNLNESDVLNKNFLVLLKSFNRSEYLINAYNKVKLQKEKFIGEYEFINSSSQRKIFRVTLIPLLDKNKKIDIIIGNHLDITNLVIAKEKINELNKKEKIRLEQKVKEQTKDLKKATKELIEKEKLASLGSLVSGVAHEINTPLGIAVTSASYIDKLNNDLMKKVKNGAISKKEFLSKLSKITESIETLNINLEKASNLIKDFKKVSITQSREEKVMFNLYDYIEAVITSLKHEFKNNNYKINLDCDRNLEIFSIPGVFSQVFTNLIMNSITHGFKDKDYGKIHIQIEKKEDNLNIKYSDNGIGISKDNLSKIYDPFFTTNRKEGGSG